MLFKINKKVLFISLLFVLGVPNTPFAQQVIKWMSVGSLQDWYSSMGSEKEEGIINPQTGRNAQQTGWQWPADHQFMDIQAWKGLWIGAKNFTDANGAKWDYRVVHTGPRVSGAGEFIPIHMYMKSKYPQPTVFVEGNDSRSINEATVDSVDPNMLADREIVNVTATLLGVTMTRRIFQFTHPYHDNYIIQEYTLTNTGNTDKNPATIELPNNNIEGLVMFLQARLAPCFYSRYVIGNSSGWGVNTTYDARGDGLYPDPLGENFRAQFAWHGRYPTFTLTDNIGGPIWTVADNVFKGDTVGRLAASQFAGFATLYADKSATEKVDDPAQPKTTSTFDSDHGLESNNDAFNKGKMAAEYAFMTVGHDRRHLDKIGETNLLMPTKDPMQGTQGGYSMGNGYGPYNLKPGESVRIVICQAAAGMGWEAAEKVGRDFKSGRISALQKNTEVMKGKDSLFATFRRAKANMESGWKLTQPPAPPKSFTVDGLGDRVELTWAMNDEGDPNVQGFQIFRAMGRRDSTYRLLQELPANARSFKDTTALRGVDCYYHLRVVGKTMTSDPALGIPAARLTSSKYLTQTYDPATLKRPAGTSMDQIRIVPNPFSLGSDPINVNFPEKRDRLWFYDIPGRCTIKIYTEYGELIQSIEHTNGSGDEYWDCNTSDNQLLVSGIYIAVIRNSDTGAGKILKFVIIR